MVVVYPYPLYIELEEENLTISGIDVRWRHGGIGDRTYDVVSWIPIGDDGERIEELEQFSDSIPFNPEIEAPLLNVTNITQGECYDVRVISFDVGETPTYSDFKRVQTRKKQWYKWSWVTCVATYWF